MQLLEVRYYQGKGRLRQYSYWVWADLVVAAVAVGPAVVAALGRTAAGARQWREVPPTVVLAVGAVVAILAATLSGLSKSEVERIWLPFMLWLVPLTALLPRAHSRRWLAASAGWALLVGALYRTTW